MKLVSTFDIDLVKDLHYGQITSTRVIFKETIVYLSSLVSDRILTSKFILFSISYNEITTHTYDGIAVWFCCCHTNSW